MLIRKIAKVIIAILNKLHLITDGFCFIERMVKDCGLLLMCQL